jgi:hypothetical protein
MIFSASVCGKLHLSAAKPVQDITRAAMAAIGLNRRRL